MMKYFLLLFASFMATAALAQDYNKTPEFLKANSVWTFGTNAGYDFNTRTPLRKSLNSSEACASVSDRKTGELLFYSDGKSCWNGTGALMGGGNGTLMGNETTAQGVVIVPFIDDSNKYYIFTLEHQGGYGAIITNPPVSQGRLSYSVVDMTLNKGLGKIPAAQRNISIDTFFGEMMIAVPGNNCDVWILTHTIDSAVFKAYNVSAAGVNMQPVISRTGAEISGSVTTSLSTYVWKWGSYMVGNMAISPDRSKLALTSKGAGLGTLLSYEGLINGAMVCNFNATTGVVSDAIILDTIGCYGASFSPDNSKLYISTLDLAFSSQLNQYDVSSFNSSAIASSKKVIKNFNAQEGYGLKLFNDTIYMAFGGTKTFPYMRSINKPNLSGLACDFQDTSINLVPTTIGAYALPNEVVFSYPANIIHELKIDTIICAPIGGFPTIPIIAPTGYNAFTWEDGTQVGDREITEPGVYWLESKDGCHSRTDTFIFKQIEFEPPVINVNIHQLGTTSPYTTYQWLLDNEIIPGATKSVYTVMKNGNYRVVVSKDLGCRDTSAVYEVNNVSNIMDRDDLANAILVYPNPATDFININAPIAIDLSIISIEGKIMRTIQKAKQVSLNGLADGIYFLHIYNQDGNLLKVEKIIKKL